MKILVFDTCFNKSYIVLSEYNGNAKQIIRTKILDSDEKNYHSVYLIPALRDIFRANNLSASDLDAIGVNIGPGSFTGIRSGVVIARVLAQQTGIKLVGVDSLEILSKLDRTEQHTTVVLDARKNKVYYGEYEHGAAIINPCLKEKSELISVLKQATTIISDTSICKYLLQEGITSINYEESDFNLGLYLETIVMKKLKSAESDYNWAKVKPLYIQPPSITKSAKGC